MDKLDFSVEKLEESREFPSRIRGRDGPAGPNRCQGTRTILLLEVGDAAHRILRHIPMRVRSLSVRLPCEYTILPRKNGIAFECVEYDAIDAFERSSPPLD